MQETKICGVTVRADDECLYINQKEWEEKIMGGDKKLVYEFVKGLEKFARETSPDEPEND